MEVILTTDNGQQWSSCMLFLEHGFLQLGLFKAYSMKTYMFYYILGIKMTSQSLPTSIWSYMFQVRSSVKFDNDCVASFLCPNSNRT